VAVRYLVLLRGVNVGGRNRLPMAELRATLTEAGFEDVKTYIASGNAFVSGPREPQAQLAQRLEGLLGVKVVVLTGPQLRRVVEEAPEGFGGPEHRCDVIFLRPPLDSKRAHGLFDPREGIDQVWAGPNVIYFSRLAARASGSRLSRIIGAPEYKNMTIRSWSTTRRLHELMAADA
jgi:uncharacterized protein (DUF1697 family)